ncbi:hypothetical protein [Photobacterium sp. J15]|uniref:hypothetical protein n=1 Tax=Photobacterium sp. J15 TaxID=265901 RepID=UPI0007E4C2E1|nr:hypothetical protein [Photobacterium sp. J15]
MNEQWPYWAQNLSIVFSGIGIIVSLFLLYEAKEIRKSFKRKATLPALNKRLLESSRLLNELLSQRRDNWDAKKFSVELTKLQACLEQSKDTLKDEDRKSVEKYINDIKSFTRCSTQSDAWYFYEQLQYIATKLEQTEQNLAWD